MAKGTPNGGIKGTLANGLVAHYSFNDGSLADLSGNGNNLIATGNIYDIIDKDGQDYQAKTFPNGILQTPLNFQTELTLSIWYLVKNGTGNTNLLGFTDSSIFDPTTTDAIKFENNLIKAYCYDGGIKTLPSSDLLNGWYNIIATYKNNNYMRLYINKIFIGEILVANRQAVVDRVASKNIQSDTAIDEIRIYNRIITGKPINIGEAATGEIAEIFDMGVNFKGDITPPTFNTINTSNVTANSVDLNINCSENATAYYKLYDKNATAPTSAGLKTTHDGKITLTANNLVTENITGLTALKDYDLYVVAEDTSGNLQATPSLLQFKAGLGKVATPTTDSPSGTYENGKIVTLSCATPGAEIRFTIDGSEPTEISQLYSAPLEITESKQVRVKAYKSGYTESDTLSLNYTITTGGESMNTIYFGDDDIKVRISSEKAFKGGNLNKVIVVTNEGIVPLAVFSGNGGNEALELYLASTLDVVAPKLQEAVKKLLMQVDNDGNPVIPEYFYVIGHNVTATLEANLLAAADACDYYGIVPVFQNDGFVSNILTDICVPKHRVVIASDTAKVLSYTNKSDRLIAIYDPTEEYKNAAWTGRVLQYDSFIGWKWKNLAGCTVDGLTDTEQLAAKNSGLNYYKMIRGVANTSGSLSAKSENSAAYHIDEVIAKDIIISNVATSLLEMFQKNEIISLGFAGKIEVEKAIRVALIYCGNLGLIERNEDKSYQFTVTVPDITAEMRQSRKLTGVKFSYVLAVNMEQIVVDGLELLELIEGGSN